MAQEARQDEVVVTDERTGYWYKLKDLIGTAAGATVYQSAFSMDWFNDLYDVSVKKIDLERNPHIYVLMPHMRFGSLRYIMSSGFNNGLPEDCIAVALKETLLGLCHIHVRRQLHRDITAGHIFVDDYPSIKLAFAASVYEHGVSGESSSSERAITISKWAAAPEVFNSNNEYTDKADIWLFGITALELAYGRLGVSDRQTLESITNNITKKRRLPNKLEDYQEGKKKGKEKASFFKAFCAALGKGEERAFSKSFQKMVASCLAEDPEDRPTLLELLEHEFFKNCKDIYYFLAVVMPRMRDLKLVPYVV
ncbi:hypothetical protein F0562_014824 [Nyssa sinensis]|uniref:Protein kinase domain-containing protein n=1 Tax=Nyssa sinensis TaxID=561372 RepID=A0A5J4ZS69_9ASTE|nr:hypothetical protein F0562_014824 [Nyssa sinensis]